MSSPRDPTAAIALSASLTSFIGRASAIAELSGLLAPPANTGQPAARLVPLVGAGGCGKTRLALAVADAVAPHFADGVRLVALDALNDAEHVPQAVAGALDIREAGSRTLLDTAIAALQARSMVLVLDNCEHLVAACTELANLLLQACPQVRILATSREPLGLPGEQVWRVPPLSLPGEPGTPALLGGEPSVADPRQAEAVQLFLARAALHRPAFQLDAETVATVAEICRRLDGMPLAIELAAARTSTLGVAAILARLDERFRLLTGGGSARPARHQTLRATIDWSVALLSHIEQVFYARLAVFAGSCSLEAVEAVALSGLPESEYGPDLVQRLVDRSLLVVQERGLALRYRLLETLRVDARARLAQQGDLDQVQRGHAAFFLALAEQVALELSGPAQQDRLRQLDEEHDNLRSALSWFAAHEEGTDYLHLAVALWRFWYLRGYLSEGRAWLERGLQLNGEVPRTVRAAALSAAGWLAKEQADLTGARQLHEESLALWQGLDDRQGIATALSNLGSVAFEQDNYPLAATRFGEALAIYRSLDLPGGVARMLTNLGLVQPSGDYAAVSDLYDEALAIYSAAGDQRGIAILFNNWGLAAFQHGDAAGADALYARSLTICRDLGYRYGIAVVRANQGYVARQRGDVASARSLQQQSLVLGQAVGHTSAVLNAVRSLAVLDADAQQWERAARLFGAAAVLTAAAGATVPPPYRATYDVSLTAVRAALPGSAFAVAWAEGTALSLDQVVTLAIATVPDPPDADAAEPRPPAPPLVAREPQAAGNRDGLSRRERDVLRLLIDGASNKEIAQALTLSVRTVEHHINSLYRKLGAHTRAQAIATGLRAGATLPPRPSRSGIG